MFLSIQVRQDIVARAPDLLEMPAPLAVLTALYR
jgi:hypothetical protein